MQHLPSIISEGKYLGETKPHKEREDFVSFHHFQKKVDLNGKPVNVIVDVGRRPDGKYEFSAYNLAHSDSSRFESKKTGLRSAGLTVEDKKKALLPLRVSQTLGQNKNLASENTIPIKNAGVNIKHKLTISAAIRTKHPYPQKGGK